MSNSYTTWLWAHRRPKLGIRFIRLCMRVELYFVNCLKMSQNKEIKMAYLIVVVLLCVLGVSGAFQAIYELWPSNGQNSNIAWNAPNTPRTHNDNEVSHIYFFLYFELYIFNQFTKSSLTLMAKSYKSHPKLGPPVRGIAKIY